MASSPNRLDEARQRRVLRMLADLLASSEHELGAFVERRLGELAGVSIDAVGSARALLQLLADALEEGGAETWARVERAWAHVDVRSAASDVADNSEPSPDVATRQTASSEKQTVSVAAPSHPVPIRNASPPIVPKQLAASPWAPAASRGIQMPSIPIQPPAAGPPVEPPQAGSVPEMEPSPPSVDETVAMMPAIRDEDILPFSGKAAAPPPVAAKMGWHPAQGQTEDVAAAFGQGMTLPFASASKGLNVPITVEQYAAMVAKCEAEPARRAELQREQGIHTEVDRQRVDAWFARAFELDKEVAARYRELLQDCRDWIARTRGGAT